MPFFVVMSELFINLVSNLMYCMAVQCSVCTAWHPVLMKEKWTQRPVWDADLQRVNCDHLSKYFIYQLIHNRVALKEY